MNIFLRFGRRQAHSLLPHDLMKTQSIFRTQKTLGFLVFFSAPLRSASKKLDQKQARRAGTSFFWSSFSCASRRRVARKGWAQPPFAFSLNDGFQDSAQIFINTLLLPLPMNISAYVEKEQKTKAVALREGALVKDLLSELGVNPVTVIVSRNNELMVDDDELNDGDSIKIISVISGG